MDLLEAQEVVTEMLDTAVQDVMKLKARLGKLRREYEEDAWELTAAQIKLVEARLERRVKEANALGVMASSF